MRMSMGRQALMVVAALGLGAIAGADTPTVQNDVRTGGTARRGGRGGSNRHVQRMAVKKRNQARHRAACRGRS